MVATLTSIFGIEHLTLAEDAVQEALARALQTWPFYGVPKNPAAWLMQTARNRALDVVRRENVFRDKEAEIIRLTEEDTSRVDTPIFSEEEIADDRLRLMFVCCHPQIPAEAQVALALKTLCGFGVTDIARAFLTTDAAVAKRLTRARQKIAESKIPFEIPAGAELARRLDGVLQSLYLLFNEGYKASAGDKLVREDICAEAIRLTDLLAQHPAGNQPKTHAVLALMLLNAARTPVAAADDGARDVPSGAVGGGRGDFGISFAGGDCGLPLRGAGLCVHGLAENSVTLRPAAGLGRFAGGGVESRGGAGGSSRSAGGD